MFQHDTRAHAARPFLLFGRSAAAPVFATDSGLFHDADGELLQPVVDCLARPKTMATTWRLYAWWQWIASTQLVAQSTERDAQQVRDFVVGIIGPTTVRVAFGHARHSAVLFGVMVCTMKTKNSRNDHTKSHRSLLAFA